MAGVTYADKEPVSQQRAGPSDQMPILVFYKDHKADVWKQPSPTLSLGCWCSAGLGDAEEPDAVVCTALVARPHLALGLPSKPWDGLGGLSLHSEVQVLCSTATWTVPGDIFLALQKAQGSEPAEAGGRMRCPVPRQSSCSREGRF